MSSKPPGIEEFKTALRTALGDAQRNNLSSVEVEAGKLHRQLGGYPSQRHNMPGCCNAMRAEMKTGDVIVSSPPSGFGASLTIRYALPRPR